MINEITFSELFWEDLIRLGDFLYQNGEEQEKIRAVLLQLVDRTEILLEYPEMGQTLMSPLGNRTGFRYLLEEPYLIFYRTRGARAEVLRAFHHKENYIKELRKAEQR